MAVAAYPTATTSYPTSTAAASSPDGTRTSHTLPDTTMSRSIIIEMKRKTANETVVHFRSVDDAGLDELRRRSLRWAADNGEKLDRR